VDPFHPVPYRFYTPDVPNGCRPQGWTDVTVSSVFLGDNHAGYDGRVRYSATFEFDWDGTAITNLAHSGAPGTSTRRWTVKNNKTSAAPVTCDQTPPHPDRPPNVIAVGNSFTVGYTHATNLVLGAPPLVASLNGTIGPDGTITLVAHATAFPSAGYRITRNGSVLRTRIFRNASCKAGLGAEGLVNLTTGLGSVGLLSPLDVTTVLQADPSPRVVACNPKTPIVGFRGGQFGGAGSSRGW
jgi:hypothetical protein